MGSDAFTSEGPTALSGGGSGGGNSLGAIVGGVVGVSAAMAVVVVIACVVVVVLRRRTSWKPNPDRGEGLRYNNAVYSSKQLKFETCTSDSYISLL